MLQQVHPRTFELLGAQGPSIVQEFQDFMGSLDPSYFAMYLRYLSSRRPDINQALGELASTEWALYFAANGPRLPSASPLLPESLNLVRCEFNVLDLLEGRSLNPVKTRQVLGVFWDEKTNQSKVTHIKMEWALFLDFLSDESRGDDPSKNNIDMLRFVLREPFSDLFPERDFDQTLSDFLHSGLIRNSN